MIGGKSEESKWTRSFELPIAPYFGYIKHEL